jgi:hypothetical protein
MRIRTVLKHLSPSGKVVQLANTKWLHDVTDKDIADLTDWSKTMRNMVSLTIVDPCGSVSVFPQELLKSCFVVLEVEK